MASGGGGGGAARLGPLMRVIVGPMFSGKTSRLLQLVEELEPRFASCVVAKWSEDLRAGSRLAVATHAGRRRTDNVQAFATLDDVVVPKKRSLLVAVDEGQFFGDDLLRLHDRLADVETPGLQHALIVAGLDLDFRKRPFGRMLDLAARADPADVEYLTARCHFCGEPAPYTSRTVASGDQVLVGGAESYQPTCPKHHPQDQQEDLDIPRPESDAPGARTDRRRGKHLQHQYNSD